MANTATTAKQAAREDRKETGPAKLPDTQPAATKTTRTPEERAAAKAKLLEDHVRLLQARTQGICFSLADQGVASLAGRIGAYDDVPQEIVEACILEVQNRLNACTAALKARTANKPAVAKVDLRATAAKLQAMRQAPPAPVQA
jgi:hypothetical protein